MPEMTPTDAGRAGWVRALDTLEAELGEMLVSTLRQAQGTAGSTTQVSTSGWTPPGGLGPIPADLEARARKLLAGQRELIAELEHTKRATAAQLRALRKMPATRPAAASVYLDTNG
ncbi:hypothetical protein [Glaciibacter sp. 2TAF33]|uniref:hypothetical protein n=1 Tax=Glaciibacter sp. 2TAF33 TaxID=3233015 RepID=UPI003F92E060